MSTSQRPCKTAPAGGGEDRAFSSMGSADALRQARAAAFMKGAKDRHRSRKHAPAKEEAADYDEMEVCIAHGLPECSKCRRAAQKAAKAKQFVEFEVENTSLQIGGGGDTTQRSGSGRPGTGRPGRGSSTQRSAQNTQRSNLGRKMPLSDVERWLQPRLFRHKRASIEAACAKADRGGEGYLDKGEFSDLLGSLMLHPGAGDFGKLWREYDPSETGRISFASWVKRFISSASIPEGSHPCGVIVRSQQSHEALTARSQASSRASSRTAMTTSRLSIDCDGISRGQSTRRGMRCA